MNVNERDEITAAVQAHGELGPAYDTAVAEGLVERIGEEIDRRIDVRLGQPAQPATARMAAAYRDTGQPPSYRGPAMPMPPGPAAGSPPAQRNAGAVSGVILGLGSMGLGVGATAVVTQSAGNGAAQVLMVLLIWAAIAAINVAHARRH